jgi:hypothetical protein
MVLTLTLLPKQAAREKHEAENSVDGAADKSLKKEELTRAQRAVALLISQRFVVFSFLQSVRRDLITTLLFNQPAPRGSRDLQQCVSFLRQIG